MAILFTNNDRIRTAPLVLFGGASQAAVSFTIRILGNALPNVQQHLFIEQHRGLFDSLISEGAWNLQGGFGSARFRSFPIEPGRTYSYMFTASSGSGRYYRDGDHQEPGEGIANPLPSPGPRWYQWGGQASNGFAVLLQDFYAWRGYVPTEAERKGLRDRTIDPMTIGPDGPSLALPMLAGAAGKQPGDPVTQADLAGQLVGASLNATNPVIGAPTWAEEIAWTNPIVHARVAVGGYGRTLAIFFGTTAGSETSPVVSSPVTTHPSVRYNGGSPIELAHPLRRDRADHHCPYLLYALPEPVEPGDELRVTAPNEWVRTEDGYAPALDVIATGPEFALDSAAVEPHNVPMGVNLMSSRYWDSIPTFADLTKQTTRWGQVASHDGNLWPTALDGPHYELRLPVTDGRRYPSVDDGEYTILWDIRPGGDTSQVVTFHGDGGGTVPNPTITLLPGEVTGQQTNNRRVYSMQRARKDRDVILFARATSADVTNIRIYAPGVDPESPGLFHPRLLKRLQPFGVVRYMDYYKTNNSNRVRLADHWSEDRINWDMSGLPTRTVTLLTAEPYDNADKYLLQNDRIFVKFTTDGPHNLRTGFVEVTFQNVPQVELANGAKLNVRTYDAIRVLSPTEFAIANPNDGHNSPVLGVQDLTGGEHPARLRVETGAPPLSHIGKLSEATNTSAWYCVPHAVDDSDAEAIALEIVAHYPRNRPIRIELSNEVWQALGSSSFRQSWHFWGLGRLWGLDQGRNQQQWWTAAYVKRSHEVWTIFRQVWADDGRDPDEVIRVLGTQWGNPGWSADLAKYCQQSGITFDELAVAPYFRNGPGFHTSAWDRLAELGGADGLVEAFEWAIQYDRHAISLRLPQHINALRSHGLHETQVVAYEGGTEIFMNNWGRTPENARAKEVIAREAIFNPRHYNLVLNHMREWYEHGGGLWVDYSLQFILRPNNDPPEILRDVYAWPHYPHWTIQAGRGDGSDGKTDNRAVDPTDWEHIVSPKAQAYIDFAAAYDPEAPPGEPGEPGEPGNGAGEPGGPIVGAPGALVSGRWMRRRRAGVGSVLSLFGR